MKLRILATSLILATVMAAPASAMVTKHSLSQAVNSAITSGNVHSVVNGNTVTLFGNVDSVYEANKAENAALKIFFFDKVINVIYTSN